MRHFLRAVVPLVLASFVVSAPACKPKRDRDSDSDERRDKKRNDKDDDKSSGDKGSDTKGAGDKSAGDRSSGGTGASDTPKNANGDDPIVADDVPWMRQRTTAIYGILKAALTGEEASNVAQIPLVFDPAPEINAFAACLKTGAALVAFTDRLMAIQAHLARASATDEVFGTKKATEYENHVVASRGNSKPPAGLFDPAQDRDRRKLARQHQLFDEAVAFTLGHELAHHYLKHTGCIGNDRTQATTADLGRTLSRQLPAFNQVNESSSDTYGVHNVLTAGKKQSPAWTERGGLLTFQLFRALRRNESVLDGVLDFHRTHPHPDVRAPIVEAAAEAWRLTGGIKLPAIPALKLPGL